MEKRLVAKNVYLMAKQPEQIGLNHRLNGLKDFTENNLCSPSNQKSNP